MKKQILVAGAGHGGLVAAARLAQAGYDVRVFEAQNEKDLGYDWTDCASKKITDKEKLELSEKDFVKTEKMSYYMCSGTTPIVQDDKDVENNPTSIERKVLLAALIKKARKSGAEMSFGVKVISPIIEDDRMAGIVTDGGVFMADLIIDAAGVDSPLRSALPERFGVENKHETSEVLYAYRAIFDKTEKFDESGSPYEIFLRLQGIKGISWCITGENSVDMLIGSFEPIDDAFVKNQLEYFRQIRPQLGEKVLRGGDGFKKIATRRPLAQFVANGYAAVGDSAYMCEPMTGSGINLSMQAGAILAQTVISDTEGLYSVETLWQYNYKYIRQFAGDAASLDILKNVILNLGPDKLDFLMEKEIITKDDLSNAGSKTKTSDILIKLKKGMGQLPSLIKLAASLSKGSSAKKVYRSIPESYDRRAVEKWKDTIAKTVVPVE